MKIEKDRIEEFDKLIEESIGGDSVSSNRLNSISRNLTVGEIDSFILRFQQEKKYHHVHYFACEMYDRFDKNAAVDVFLNNGDYFSPSLYWAGLHYYRKTDFARAKEVFERGWSDSHWHSGKLLSDICFHGGIIDKIEAVEIRLILAYEAIYVEKGGRDYARFIYGRF